MGDKFTQSLIETKNVRNNVPDDLKPLFDHIINLAMSSYAHGYAKRAGIELRKARKLGEPPKPPKLRALSPKPNKFNRWNLED